LLNPEGDGKNVDDYFLTSIEMVVQLLIKGRRKREGCIAET